MDRFIHPLFLDYISYKILIRIFDYRKIEKVIYRRIKKKFSNPLKFGGNEYRYVKFFKSEENICRYIKKEDRPILGFIAVSFVQNENEIVNCINNINQVC